MTRLILALGLVLALTGAKANFGCDFKEAGLASVAPGQSTKADVASALACEPASTAAAAGGKMVYVWMHSSAKSSMWTGRTSSQARTVSMVFTADGKLDRVLNVQGFQLDPAETKRLLQPGT